jgi:hypothetical protein
MLPHEQILTACFLCMAFLQLVAMSCRLRLYLTYRHRLATFNRLMRILIVLLSVFLTTPAHTNRQVIILLESAAGTDVSNIFISGSSPLHAFGANAVHAACSSGLNACAADSIRLPAAAAGRSARVQLSTAALAKAFLAVPFVYVNHANFLVPFRYAVVLQIITCLATIGMDVHKLCINMVYAQASSAAVVPACKGLSWLMQLLGQVLDWHFSATPADLSTASDAVCEEPLAALLLMKIWAHVVLLVLLPFIVIYKVEYSLKTKFLSGQAGAEAAAAEHVGASSPRGLQRQQPISAAGNDGRLQAVLQEPQQERQQEQPLLCPTGQHLAVKGRQGSSSGGHAAQQDLQSLRQQQARMLSQALNSVEPLPLGPMLVPIRGALWWRLAVVLGLVLSASMVCFYLCEIGMIVMLRSGRQLTCDAEGWLHFV